eukprot:881630-Lingulodinium_polyedra.AAC.1
MKAFQELGFDLPVHPDIQMAVSGHFKGIMTTNINEEVIGFVKNQKGVKAASRYRRPEVSM